MAISCGAYRGRHTQRTRDTGHVQRSEQYLPMRSPLIGTNTATRHLLAGGPWSWLHPLCCSLGGNSVHRAIVASLDALANQREHGEKQTALTVPVC